MGSVISIKKARSARIKKTAADTEHKGFTPCDQDMTICGDCEGNRKSRTCPRLKEWLAKRHR